MAILRGERYSTRHILLRGGRRRNTKAELSQNNVGFSRVAVAMQQPHTGDFERPVTSIPFMSVQSTDQTVREGEGGDNLF